MNTNYARAILELRATLELSQEDFGKLIGASIASVSRWERGEYEPTKIVKVKLEKLFKENNISFVEA